MQARKERWEKWGHRVPEAFRDLWGRLAGRARWAALAQTGREASRGTRDLRVTGVLMASRGCLVSRAKGVTLALWGGLVPQEKMVRREQRDLRDPLARLGSRAPED